MNDETQETKAIEPSPVAPVPEPKPAPVPMQWVLDGLSSRGKTVADLAGELEWPIHLVQSIVDGVTPIHSQFGGWVFQAFKVFDETRPAC